MEENIVGLVPAAGTGTRMYPFSRAVPKEIYPIMGKAVIEHCVENLKEGGIQKIYMIVGHQKGALMDYIGDGSFFDVDVAYIYQLQRKGLGHAVLQARDWIQSSFAVLLGDSFIEPKSEINRLIDMFREKEPVAAILLFEVSDPTGYGIVKLKGEEKGKGIIEDVVEKPTLEEAKKYKNDGGYYAITGAYIFHPKIFKYIEKTPPGAKDEIQITDSIKMAIENGEKAYGMVLNGSYIDIGKWRTTLEMEKKLLQGKKLKEFIEEREKLAEKIKPFREEEG